MLLSATQGFVTKQCAAGEHVIFKTFPDTGHGTIALKAAPDVVSFFVQSSPGIRRHRPVDGFGSARRFAAATYPMVLILSASMVSSSRC